MTEREGGVKKSRLLYDVISGQSLFSLLFVAALNDTVILDESNKSPSLIKSAEYLDDMLFDEKLSADKSEIGVEVNENVEFTEKGGPINLTLNELAFKICTRCHGIFHVCYESFSPISTLQSSSCSSSQCEIKIERIGEFIVMTGTPAGIRTNIDGCENLRIDGTISKFTKISNIDVETCIPKIENGMIHLVVKHADPMCPVLILNAKIKYPEVITTPRPSTSKPDPTSEAAIPIWAIVLICILGVLLIVGLIVLGVYFYKKRQNSKKTVSPVEEPKQITVVTAEAKETVETPSKTRPDLNFTKFEPGESRKSHKKAAATKKEATKEPTTTEEFVPTPPPKVTESAPPDPSKPEPKLPQGYYPFIPRIIPKSYKSLKTDSLEETIKKNKMTPVETVVDSLRRNCLKDSDSKIVKEMKQKYPEIERPILKAETELLCVPVGEMYKKLNGMANGAEANLTALGVQFDSAHRIVIMTSEGRKYLQNPTTPPTLVYFAFGAEYHELVTDDMNKMPKFSMAHLLVIAMQPRFEEYHRRKALTWLRRELPKIRGNYFADERKTMPFPINAIEKAFELDPKFLLSLSGIDADSEGDRKRMAEAKKKKQAMKNLVGDDSKRKKKKSTKKRE